MVKKTGYIQAKQIMFTSATNMTIQKTTERIAYNIILEVTGDK